MDWKSTYASLPAKGEDVVVFDCLDGERFYAIAHIEEGDDGSQYWDSPDDYFHGTRPQFPRYWSKLDAPPSVD
jgi:hypothetical protein